MSTVHRYFAASKEAIRNLLKKPDTILFPAAHVAIPDDFRGNPTLDETKCTLCNRCVRVCPTWALSIEKIEKNHGFFTVDLGRCCYCQECEDICPFDAIHLKPLWLNSSDTKEGTRIRSEVTIERKSKK